MPSDAAATVDAESVLVTPAVQAVQRHLSAVVSRNMGGVLDTITRLDELTLIIPDGSITKTREKYIDFHKEWFAHQDWTMRFRIAQVTQTESMVVALTEAHYIDAATPTGRKSWVTFVFVLEEGHWRLKFDQNTKKSAE